MPTRGIDVGARAGDIRRITLKYFYVRGVDPDDLVADVTLRILEQNNLPGSAFDPSRGSFGKYVYLVASNRAAVLARRECARARLRDAMLDAAREPAHGASVEDLVAAVTSPDARPARNVRRRLQAA